MINKIQIYEKLNKPKKSFEIYNHKALYAVIASEGIRIHHSLQLSQVMQQILRKVY